MKYDALVMVNNQNKETRRKMEERKIKNRIRKLIRKVGLSKWQSGKTWDRNGQRRGYKMGGRKCWRWKIW